jgi:hypothetical protein
MRTNVDISNSGNVWRAASAYKVISAGAPSFTERLFDGARLRLVEHPAPEIFNTDQGSQFTSMAFTRLLEHNGITINMDGRGAGGTTCSSSASGRVSSTRRCT